MVTATKEFTWDMAHMLEGHLGLCRNLHGHTYKMLVTVSRPEYGVVLDGPSAGMVVDFKQLKDEINYQLVSLLDHACMINVLSQDIFEQELYQLLQTCQKKVYPVKYRPTAENMVIHFQGIISAICEDMGLRLEEVKIFETPTSYAIWNRRNY